MKIYVDGTLHRITFDPMQHIYIGIQCLDFKGCTELDGMCYNCPFYKTAEVDLEDIIKGYLRSVQESESN